MAPLVVTKNQGNSSDQDPERIALIAHYFPTGKAHLSDILGSDSVHRDVVEAFIECEIVLRRLRRSNIVDARKILEYQRLSNELKVEILNILDERAHAGFEP